MTTNQRDSSLPNARIRRSAGLLIAEFNDGLCAYDLPTDRVHLLGSPAYRLIRKLPANISTLFSVASDIVPPESNHPESDLMNGIGTLIDLGILNGRSDFQHLVPVSGSPREPVNFHLGESHQVLDHVLAFRSHSSSLLAEIDGFIGPRTSGLEPNIFFDVDQLADGKVALQATDLWEFPSLPNFSPSFLV